MAKLTPARKVALALLSEQRRRDAHIHDVARNSDAFNALDERDRNFCMTLVCGVNVTQGLLDLQLDTYFDKPKSIEPRVRDAMRISTFEILYHMLSETAVDQGVELVRSVQPYAAGMANAVLRRIVKKQAMMQSCKERVGEIAQQYGLQFDDLQDIEVRALEATCGYPAWLTQCLIENMEPYLVARMCLDALGAAPSSQIRIGQGENTSFIPCDLSAQCVAGLAAVPGGRVLEVGQGRGTKSLIMAHMGSEVAGCELHKFKCAETERRASFYGYSNQITATAFDGLKLGESELPQTLSGQFDSVLLDAPCSGTGTMRRHPEIPWHLEQDAVDPGNPSSLCALQLKLIKAASARVAPEGQLIYSTCSVLKAENDWIINAFLSSEEGSAFKRLSLMAAPGLDNLTEMQQSHIENNLTPQGNFQSYPAAGLPDGHFCCRLVRIK